MLGIRPEPSFETIYAAAQQGKLADGQLFQAEKAVEVAATFQRVVDVIQDYRRWPEVDDFTDVQLPRGTSEGGPIDFKVEGFRAIGQIAQARLLEANNPELDEHYRRAYRLFWVTESYGSAAADDHWVAEDWDLNVILAVRERLYAPRVMFLPSPLGRAIGRTGMRLIFPEKRLRQRQTTWLHRFAAAAGGTQTD